MLDTTLFAIAPYVAGALFIVGLIYRGFINPFMWTARPSGFMERPALGAALLTFHWGIIMLLIAHLIGLVAGLFVIPVLVNVFYWLGFASGVLVLYGSTLALVRRIIVPEVRAMSRAEDYILLLLFFAIAGVALYLAWVTRVFGLSLSVGPWIGSIFRFQPDASLMAGLPLLNKVHISLFLALLAYWPYTKLVHVWAFPWRFITRPRITMRAYVAPVPAPELATLAAPADESLMQQSAPISRGAPARTS